METITIQVPDGCDIQIVRKKENKEPVIRTYQDIIDNAVNIDTGYWIGDNSSINELSSYTINCDEDKGIAASEKVAKSMLAMAMISQLMPYYGGEVTDEELGNTNIYKYIIRKEGNRIDAGISYTTYHFLAFHTEEQRDNFLKYNEQLVRDYLMIE